MATRSCRSWCIFRELGRWGGRPSHWKVLSSKSIGFWKDIVSKSWLLICIQRLTTKRYLTWILAEYLADTIAWLMRSILGHDSKILCDEDTQQLLTPKFWVLPLYRELQNSARRIRPSPSSQRARGCTGLVKVICKENKEQKRKRKYHAGTPHPNDRGGFTQWFGSCSLITTLYVWFPACWAPMVTERGLPLATWSVRLRASP